MQITKLRQGSLAEAFARLVALQPALVEIETEVRRRKAHASATSGEASSSRLRACLRAYVRQSLTPLVGPAAADEDKLLRSHTANELALHIADRHTTGGTNRAPTLLESSREEDFYSPGIPQQSSQRHRRLSSFSERSRDSGGDC